MGIHLSTILRHAKKQRLSKPELQAYAVAYASDPQQRTNDLRDRIVDGASWVVAELVVRNIVRTGDRCNAEDQMQAGILALYDAVGAYKADQGAEFLTYADKWVRPAVTNTMINRNSVVKHPGGGVLLEADVPVKGMVDDTGDGSLDLGVDVPDPEGSVLDVLLQRESGRHHDNFAEALGEFEATRRALLNFHALPLDEQEQVRLRMGLGLRTFKATILSLDSTYLSQDERVLATTSNIHRQPPDRSNSEREVPLSDELRSGFIALKRRKGLSMDEVVAGLAAEFNAAGIQRSAASAYTVLHSATQPRQSGMLKSVVDALERVYAPLPDVNYLPSDQPFQALRKKMVASAITHQDMQGISRKAGLKYTSDQVKGAYNFLSENRGAAPIVLVDEVLRQSSARPADAQGQAPVRRVLRHEGLI